MIINRYLTYITFTFFSLILTYAIYSDITAISQEINNIEHVNTKLTKTIQIKKLVQELQKERGLTNICFSSPQKRQLFNLLQIQRTKVDDALQKISNTTFKDSIKKLRLQTDNHQGTRERLFNGYTKLIANMLLETKKLLIFTNDQEIKNHFLIYQNTNFVQEYLGQLRAEIGSILETNKLTQTQHNSVVKLQTLVSNYIKQTQENIILTDTKLLSPLKKSCFVQTNKIISKIIHKENLSVDVSALEWFHTSTCAIDAVNETTTRYLKFIQSEIDNKLYEKEMKLTYHLVFWSFVLLISLLLTLLLYRTTKQMRIKNKLLQDYKKAIDDSTIVSKTDKKGIITYVNKAFCKISGYSEKELLGKPHNMVRHPSLEKEVFADLWKTLKKGEVWQGQIINLAKDDTPYWVDATISPIYDDEDNLVEYMAIRHDITEIVELNKEIKNTQYELIYRMGESVESRSKESGHYIQRVAHYSKLLALYYGLSNQEAETIFIASTMHDMGKIAIPDAILLKKDKLTNEEWEIMKTHSAIGYKILAGSNLPILKMAATIAYEHHEHFNGNGYPLGKAGDEISIYARIVAVADVFDALISQRVYKEAWSLEKTIELFREESGNQFDPILVDHFLKNIESFMQIKTEFED